MIEPSLYCYVWGVSVDRTGVELAAHLDGGGKDNQENCHARILWGSNIEPPPTTMSARKTLA